MINSIKTSESNRTVVSELTNKLSMGPENVIARIALAYSVSKGRKLNLSQIADSKGKEYSSKVLFGDNQEIYTAIICQLYDINAANLDVPKYIKMHLDDGLELIQWLIQDNPNLPMFDFVLDQVNQGLQSLNNSNVQ